MQVVEPSAEILPPLEDYSQESVIKRIELIGRTAYKSEANITEDSAHIFIKNLLILGHESVLEHYVHRFIVDTMGHKDLIPFDLNEIYEETVGLHWSPVPDGGILSLNVRTLRDAVRFAHNDLTDALLKAVGAKYNLLYEDLGSSLLPKPCYDVRLISESFIKDMLPTREAMKHINRSVRFICDRGITHEIIRHRPPSYTQESTRYCNYSKKGMTFIMPPWGLTESDIDYLNNTELKYDAKIFDGQVPQQSRYFLLTGLKAEIVMSTHLKEWHHFFNLRTSKAAHPQMRQLTIPLLSNFQDSIPACFDDIVVG